MFRQVFKALEPITKTLFRTLDGIGATGGSSFQQNCVSKEEQLTKVLKQALPGITYISIQDISGGCGAMFEINVEAKEFTGISRVKQHRLVTDSLKDEIAKMHGVRINTTPSSNDK